MDEERQTPGAEQRRIWEALTAAFDGNSAGLDRVAFHAFGHWLVTLVGTDGGLGDWAFRLVKYAEARSQMPALIAAARAENPTNAALRALAGDGADAEAAAPAPRLHPSLPHPTFFLGRETEMANLTAALRAPGGRLAAIVGLGGFGKSTLAAHVARALAGQPFAAVVWSSAADAPGWTLDTLLRDFAALEPSIGQQPTPEGQRAAALAALAANPTVLIADNLESLTDGAEQRRLARFLKDFDPVHGSRALLTTRHEADWLHEILAASGGHTLPQLEGLDPANAINLLRQLGDEKRLAALVAAPDAALAPLVAAVGHSPKLIELLVGLGNWDRIREVAARLPRNLRLAQDALLADAFERLRATPGALELVQQVGVFVPSADFAALRDGAGANLPAGVFFDDALDTACATTLLSRAPAPDGTLRYRLHPLIARYLDATDTLRPPDALLVAARRNHAAYFARFAVEQGSITIDDEQHDLGPPAEQENIEAGWQQAEALRQAAITASDVDGAREAAEWVVGYGRSRASWRQDLLESSRGAAQQLNDEEAETVILHMILFSFDRNLTTGQERALYERYQELSEKQNDIETVATILINLAARDVKEGDVAAAHARYEQSLVLYRRLGNVRDEKDILYKLAKMDMEAGNMEAACGWYEEILARERLDGDVRGEGMTLISLGLLNRHMLNLAGARRNFEQSMALFRRIGDERMAVTVQGFLGLVKE